MLRLVERPLDYIALLVSIRVEPGQASTDTTSAFPATRTRGRECAPSLRGKRVRTTGRRSGPGVAAVDEEFGAGDERRGVRSQEEGCLGDFLGVGQPSQWHDGLGELVDVRPCGTQ